MPAKVIVQSGISAGTAHWIERSVIRVGSDPESDICLPSADIPSHALTLEFRGDQYRVYNRTQGDVLIGSLSLPSGAGHPWSHAESLQLGDVELMLECDADPTPQRAQVQLEIPDASHYEPIAAGDDRADSLSDETTKEGSSKILEIIVIVFCVLGAAGLLAREQLKVDDRQDPPSFTKVVRTAIASETTSRALIGRLQYAESAVIRGNGQAARLRYGELRDDLMRQKDVFVTNKREPELAILDFVEYRLGRLSQ